MVFKYCLILLNILQSAECYPSPRYKNKYEHDMTSRHHKHHRLRASEHRNVLTTSYRRNTWDSQPIYLDALKSKRDTGVDSTQLPERYAMRPINKLNPTPTPTHDDLHYMWDTIVTFTQWYFRSTTQIPLRSTTNDFSYYWPTKLFKARKYHTPALKSKRKSKVRTTNKFGHLLQDGWEYPEMYLRQFDDSIKYPEGWTDTLQSMLEQYGTWSTYAQSWHPVVSLHDLPEEDEGYTGSTKIVIRYKTVPLPFGKFEIIKEYFRVKKNSTTRTPTFEDPTSKASTSPMTTSTMSSTTESGTTDSTISITTTAMIKATTTTTEQSTTDAPMGPEEPTPPDALTGPEEPTPPDALTGPEEPTPPDALTGPEEPTPPVATMGPAAPTPPAASKGPDETASPDALTGPEEPTPPDATMGPAAPTPPAASKGPDETASPDALTGPEEPTPPDATMGPAAPTPPNASKGPDETASPDALTGPEEPTPPDATMGPAAPTPPNASKGPDAPKPTLPSPMEASKCYVCGFKEIAPYLTAVLAALLLLAIAYCLYKICRRTEGQEKILGYEWRQVGTVKDIYVYPVKSCGPVALSDAQCSTLGLKNGWLRDRFLMIVNENNIFITARCYPELLTVHTCMRDSVLTLKHREMETLVVDLAEVVLQRHTTIAYVWDVRVAVYDCGCEASEWLSRLLVDHHGVYRLVYYASKNHRRICSTYKGLKLDRNDTGALSDETSYSLINQASVDYLNSCLTDTQVSVRNFRPNFVVMGPQAHEEDHWKYVKIGTTVFGIVKPCTRCSIIVIDPETGVFDSCCEPLVTLKRYRQFEDPDLNKAAGGAPRMGLQMSLRSPPGGAVTRNDPVWAVYRKGRTPAHAPLASLAQYNKLSGSHGDEANICKPSVRSTHCEENLYSTSNHAVRHGDDVETDECSRSSSLCHLSYPTRYDTKADIQKQF